MGWKIAGTIIIRAQIDDIDFKELLNDLDLESPELTKVDNVPFWEAMDMGTNNVYIGSYKDNLIICDNNNVLGTSASFEKNISSIEQRLINHFPDTEICTIVLHSGVNLWGYSVIKNGQKIRARGGSWNDGTFLEYGSPLEQEKELLSQSIIDKDGNRVYLLDDYPGEPFSEDQVGEEFVSDIASRYFGIGLFCSSELLDTMLAGYA
ncbi:DUF6928 family protein [Candidatus Cardinium hertigii]|uniref:Uncharacterized protein n=1 Tax=Candidatus Cardinium hertigii TaxID=247481 RepID=A0A2Z3L6T5_9BACT|nr:hypothetical protein [Candidatus Cardinium hertigii]AWN81397.1 hypothetical protein DK880_00059 [Candidatus Cardinium hertigii]